ncbi:hypothetical protein L3Y34_008484 [Caenorhabditis briggsae]|uniref:Uncharacterized protein n=1 Tax=Caenorhabditis briggsae TaxID=6238 RepID=A0AAE9A9R0_CAEBR|nr:hypothetical protein L3Y34_008484 [Caenorhabditis briggsae]
MRHTPDNPSGNAFTQQLTLRIHTEVRNVRILEELFGRSEKKSDAYRIQQPGVNRIWFSCPSDEAYGVKKSRETQNQMENQRVIF